VSNDVVLVDFHYD